MSGYTSSVTTESAKRPFSSEVEGSNKRRKTESQVNGKEYVVKATTETEIRPEMPDLSSSSTASLNTKNIETANTSGSVPDRLNPNASIAASDLSQIHSAAQIHDNETPIYLFVQDMDYTAPVEDVDGTIATIGRIREGSPFYTSTRFTLGYCYLEKKEYAKADSYFVMVPPTDDRYICAQLARATCSFFQGDLENTIKYSNCVPESDLSYYSAQYKIGCAHAKKKNYSQAIEFFGVVKVPMSHLDALMSCRTGTCHPTFDISTAQLPLYDSAQFNLGCCYYNQEKKNCALAVAHFEKVIKIIHGAENPKFDAAQYYLGLIYRWQNEPAKAEICFTAVRKGSVFHPAAQYNLGLIYTSQNEPVKAVICFTDVRKGSVFHAAAQRKLKQLENVG